MKPILKRGCCLSLRTCSLILGSITLAINLLILSTFLIGIGHGWMQHDDGHFGHGEELDEEQTDAALSDEYFDGFDDSEAMEKFIHSAAHGHFAIVLMCIDFLVLLLETLTVVLLIWGAAKGVAVLLLPWLAMDLLTTLYDVGFCVYLLISGVHIAVNVLPILLLPINIYCWLVVFSLYHESRQPTARDMPVPLSMSALEAEHGEQRPAGVPYVRLA